ncbi:hypothetical protein K5X82_12430 [Halosquirtibacter xylanolyticus]|uniref:hypothetical protein n=1 Tax=Halosquirtibacter xylanolyticus TaxID=3374599 RepID=UPI003747DAA2|nr:hypothetical protein K5X82_12430 [Prolixibacteraceae bacterium]
MNRLLLFILILFCQKLAFSQSIGVELNSGFNIGDDNRVTTIGANAKYEFTPYISAVVGITKFNYTLSGGWMTETNEKYLVYTIKDAPYDTWIPSLGVEGSLPFLENKIHSLGFMGRVMGYNVPSIDRPFKIQQEGFILDLNSVSKSGVKTTVDKTFDLTSEGQGNISLAFLGGLYYRYKNFRTNLTVEQNGIDLFYDLRNIKLDDDVYMRNLLTSPGMIMWSMSVSYYFQF